MLTYSSPIKLGTKLEPFVLPDSHSREWSVSQLRKENGLVLMVICNHCPYVQIIADQFEPVSKMIADNNIGFAAINANDAKNYPEDSLDKMQEEVIKRGYSFPYLHDEKQEVVKAIGAACTPDIFVYDAQLKLYYNGCFDDCSPNSGNIPSGKSLLEACDKMVSGVDPKSFSQISSMGCSIKWK